MPVTPNIIAIILIVIASILHLGARRKELNRERVLRIILLWVLVIGVGFSGLFGFAGHVFMADTVAETIGWLTGSPFQFEVGMANLALGVIGILCYRFRDNFWLCTIVANGVFLFGDGIGHIRQMMVSGDFAPFNTGATLYWDLGFPVFTILLWLMLRKAGIVSLAFEKRDPLIVFPPYIKP
jgi:hypothetical protein